MIQESAFKRLFALAVAAGFPFLCQATLTADSINIAGATTSKISNIQVDPKRGIISYVWVGREQIKRLSDFRELTLDRYPDLDRANKALNSGDYGEAARLYAQIRPQSGDEWLTGLLLIKLVPAADQAGQFSDAVNAWVRWVDLGWAQPDVAPPSRLPAKGSSELSRAARSLEQAVESASDENKLKFQTLLLKVYQKQENPKAGALARQLAGETGGEDNGGETSSTPGLQGSVRDQAMLAQVQQLLNEGKKDAALAKAREVIPDLSREAVPQACMLVGRIYQAKGDEKRAALAYMRVAIHFAESPEAPSAMMAVAQIHEKLGRTDVAKQLYTVIGQRYKRSPEAAKAAAAIEKLN